MAESVVDIFKVIDIQKKDGEFSILWVTIGFTDGLAQHVLKKGAIRKLGEWVVGCQKILVFPRLFPTLQDTVTFHGKTNDLLQQRLVGHSFDQVILGPFSKRL